MPNFDPSYVPPYGGRQQRGPVYQQRQRPPSTAVAAAGGMGDHARPVDPMANFNLPGFEQRGAYFDQQMQGAQGRGAPQSANDSQFRGYQNDLAARLSRQVNGEESLSQIALRNSTNQNMAQQRGMAASAAPGNVAMAQRLAQQGIGSINQGYGAQAAQLGIQERNAAANALAGLSTSARGQDQQNNQFNVGAQLQNRGQNDQYGLGMGQLSLGNATGQQRGTMGYEANQTQRYGIDQNQPDEPAWWEKAIGYGVQVAPAAIMAASDERVKTNVSTPAPQNLDSLVSHLKPQQFSYKDEQRFGAGPRTGVMAQDVERGGPVGQQMVEDVGGVKMLDVQKSLGTALGLIGRLGERIDQLSGGHRRPMADGGVAMQPTSALVGEEGPEAILPLDDLIGATQTRGQGTDRLKAMDDSEAREDKKRTAFLQALAGGAKVASNDPIAQGISGGINNYLMMDGYKQSHAQDASTQAGLMGQLNKPSLSDVDRGMAPGGIRPPTLMAGGGIVTKPTSTVLGEAGPEAVIPLDKLPDLVQRLVQGIHGDVSQPQPVAPTRSRQPVAPQARRVYHVEHGRDEAAEFPFVQKARDARELAAAEEELRRVRAANQVRPGYDWLSR